MLAVEFCHRRFVNCLKVQLDNISWFLSFLFITYIFLGNDVILDLDLLNQMRKLSNLFLRFYMIAELKPPQSCNIGKDEKWIFLSLIFDLRLSFLLIWTLLSYTKLNIRPQVYTIEAMTSRGRGFETTLGRNFLSVLFDIFSTFCRFLYY